MKDNTRNTSRTHIKSLYIIRRIQFFSFGLTDVRWDANQHIVISLNDFPVLSINRV